MGPARSSHYSQAGRFSFTGFKQTGPFLLEGARGANGKIVFPFLAFFFSSLGTLRKFPCITLCYEVTGDREKIPEIQENYFTLLQNATSFQSTFFFNEPPVTSPPLRLAAVNTSPTKATRPLPPALSPQRDPGPPAEGPSSPCGPAAGPGAQPAPTRVGVPAGGKAGVVSAPRSTPRLLLGSWWPRRCLHGMIVGSGMSPVSPSSPRDAAR